MKVYSYKPAKPAEGDRGRKMKKKFKKPGLRKFFTWIFRLFALGIFTAALLFLYYAKDLPDPNKLLERNVPESTKIFARDNSLLYEIHGEYKRTLVTLDQISPDLKNATVAVEDKDFYKHGGISFTGILRAVMVDILTGKKSQGGSTITQQFVKKSILTDDKSWDRKIREIILAVSIDSRFDKDQILKLYLNEIPYGRNAYGIEAASLSYFNKNAKDLSLAESAYLAAMPQAGH
jgi:penicillin-binding protein 1A